MKRMIFFGDSITDASWNRNAMLGTLSRYGYGYVNHIAGDLLVDNANIEIINSGISGNRIVDLYARIKSDVWNYQPDILSILIGVNDIWHEIANQNGVEIDRFEKVYRMLLEDSLKALPNVKIVLLEPFVLRGTATENDFEAFLEVKDYAKIVKRLAEEYQLSFLPLQHKFEMGATKISAQHYLADGVHPSVAGAKLIAKEWLELYNKELK